MAEAKTRRRSPLTREQVLGAALGLADQGGVEAISMRRLAQDLGVEAMSLYNHVKNKDDILDGMLELVVREIELPADEADWRAALTQVVTSARETLSRHPWASRLWMSRSSAGSARLVYGESILRVLREAGFSKELVYHAFHILESLIIGVAEQHVNFPYRGEELAKLAQGFLVEIGDDYPYLAEHVRQHLDPPATGETGLELAVRLIMDGLERERDAGH